MFSKLLTQFNSKYFSTNTSKYTGEIVNLECTVNRAEYTIQSCNFLCAGQDDLPISVVRKIMGQNSIIGVSVKTVEQARCAEAEGADYVGAGAVFETSTKSDSSVIGLSTLRKIVENISIPVVAIGGISLENTSAVIDSGADGVAVVSAIFNAPNGPKEAAKSFRNVVDQAFSEKYGSKKS